MKTCTCCRHDLPVVDFYAGRAECKPCTRTKRGDYYRQNKETILIAVKEYAEKNRDVKLARDRSRYATKREALLAQKKIYYEANKQTLNSKNRAYRQANKASLIDYCSKWRSENEGRQRIWREQNKERINAATSAYRRANPNLVSEMEQRRRAAKLLALTSWDAELDALVLSEAFKLAGLRQKTVGGKWHVDHVEPLRGRSVCGLHNAFNVAVVPAAYNLSKNNRRADRFGWLAAEREFAQGPGEGRGL